MKKLNFYFIFFVLISILTGCKIIGRVLTGMKDPVHLSNDQIDKAIVKLCIPENNTFVLDSSFLKFFEKTYITNEQIAHDHLQPLQINVYSAKGELISFHINCYADGFMYLKWNTKGNFNSFPPITAAPLDTMLTRRRHLKMIRNYKTGMRLSDTFEDYDYLFIVHWNVFMKRQSKRLVKFIEKYKTANAQYKIKVLYVNDDNLYN